ncbi:MAG: MerR family transcriptional regulator [Clostridiales bacterium]|nr:MerR family transcriptional regulator [Clostridiales bacterium]
MMTVNEVSKLTGISVRTLQYYDRIGLFKPSGHTTAGYRLYNTASLEQLQQILLYRELQFPLKTIKEIMESTNFNKNKALEQQIALLTLKKEHLENLIAFAREIQMKGDKIMDFSAFNTKDFDDYAAQAKDIWGKTEEYQEYERVSKNWTKEDKQTMTQEFMNHFVVFGQLLKTDPASSEAQEQVKKLQEYITSHFYPCSTQILASLGEMYTADASMMANIDLAGGAGTAAFTAEAIRIYCQKGIKE